MSKQKVYIQSFYQLPLCFLMHGETMNKLSHLMKLTFKHQSLVWSVCNSCKYYKNSIFIATNIEILHHIYIYISSCWDSPHLCSYFNIDCFSLHFWSSKKKSDWFISIVYREFAFLHDSNSICIKLTCHAAKANNKPNKCIGFLYIHVKCVNWMNCDLQMHYCAILEAAIKHR